ASRVISRSSGSSSAISMVTGLGGSGIIRSVFVGRRVPGAIAAGRSPGGDWNCSAGGGVGITSSSPRLSQYSAHSPRGLANAARPGSSVLLGPTFEQHDVPPVRVCASHGQRVQLHVPEFPTDASAEGRLMASSDTKTQPPADAPASHQRILVVEDLEDARVSL